MNQSYYIHCYIISWNTNSLRNNVSIYLNKQFQLREILKIGGNKVFWNI